MSAFFNWWLSNFDLNACDMLDLDKNTDFSSTPVWQEKYAVLPPM